MKKWLIRLAMLVAALRLTTAALAHGPYDSSAQMIVFGDSLELSATLGMDSARQVLLNAGLSEAEAASALTVRGPSTQFDLSVDLAARFFELRAGSQLHTAQRLRVITDGVEARFTATYAGKYSGSLEVRAGYFDGIEGMKPGAFIVTDENRNALFASMLTRAKSTVEFKLPAQASLEVAAKEPATNTASAPDNVSTVASPLLAATEGSAGPASSRSRVLWIGGAVLLAGLIWAGLRAMNRNG